MSKRFEELKAEYAGAVPSRFRRTRTRLGGLADAHYVSTLQFYNLREYARDMDRNDGAVGQMVDRAVANIVQQGLALAPDTGDKGLDAYLRDRWRDWAEDPLQCDVSGKFAFPEMERLVLRHEFIDGDMFALPLDDGTIQLVEGDHVDSPMQIGGDTIHGVKISETGKPLEYWFAKTRPFARFAHIQFYAAPDGWDKKPARDENGDHVVLHIFNPKRATQTRGITVFAPIFDYLGMIEDVNYATLVKQQVASCIAVFIQRSSDYMLGARSTETQTDNTNQTLEELAPGIVPRLRPGESIQGFTPNIPGTEFFEHMRFLLRMVGANLGLPLELVMLDFTQTNFSGHRAAVDQARLGFELVQTSYPRRFHRPIYRWKARGWLEKKGLDARADPRLLKHSWTGRGWRYIEPLTDAQADKVRLENLFVSPRDLAAEHGEDYEEVVRETIEDRAAAIAAAQKKAAELSTPESPITWRDVLNLATPAGVTQTTTSNPGQERIQEKQVEQQKSAPAKKEGDVTKAELREIFRAAVAKARATT